MDEVKNVTKQVISNSFIQVGGKVLTTLLSLFITATLARSLGVFGYGEFATVFAFMAIFGVLADFGFFQILVRELARRADEQERVLANLLAMRSAFALIVYALSAGLVWFLPYSEVVQVGALILAGASFLLSTNTTLLGVFQAHHRMDKAIIGDVLSRIFLLGAVIWAFRAGWGLPEIFWLYFAANALNLAVTYFLVRPMIRLRLRYEPTEWKLFLKETIPMGMVTSLSVIYFRIDLVILSLLETPIEVGIYGAPYKILEVLMFVPGIFMGNALPAITRLVDDHKEAFRRLIQVNFDILTILAFGCLVGLALLASQAIRLVVGEEFVTSSTFALHIGNTSWSIGAPELLAFLTIPLAIVFFSYFFGTLLIASRQQSRLIIPNLVAVILNVVLNLIFIPQGSYFAAAITTIVTEIYVLVATIRLARQFVAIPVELTRFWKIGLAALAMGAVMWPVREMLLVIPLLVGALTYLAALWLLGVFPTNLFERLRRV